MRDFSFKNGFYCICPECNSTNLITDFFRNIVLCKDCGLEIPLKRTETTPFLIHIGTALYDTGLFSIVHDGRGNEIYENIEICKDIIKKNPRNIHAWKAKGDLHYNLGNHQKAFKCYNKIFELKPTKSIYLEEITHLQIDSPFSIPSNMKVNKLNLEGCSELRRIGDGLRCNHLNLRDSSISQLPPHIKVFFSLNLENCLNLESLPMYLKTGSLNVAGCVNLKALPEYLNVKYLNISSCTFSSWPENITLKHGTLTARNCENLTNIPVSLNTLSSIDIRDCVLIDSIPEGTSVRNWIDIGGTRIKSFPSSMNGVQIRWRGVPIDERMAFHPELITADEILTGQNIELRRVKLERMGYERFLSQTDADMLDLDEDPGGERKLLFINLRRDEPLVCLSVFCPSTGRQYVIRVPPDKKTCHQAAAWIAGFDDPSLYNPVVET